MRLILLGAPGAGKGTQAQILSKTFAIPKLSTSDILRAEIAKGTEEGRRLKNIMDAGHLVSDELINELVEKRLAENDVKKGFIFDGYPRTIAQAQALDEILSRKNISDIKILNLSVREPELIKRFTGRFTCVTCGTSYHKESKQPLVDGVCDNCGSNDFAVRPDDSEDAVKVRLDIYYNKTAPLIEYYKLDSVNGVFYNISGEQPIDSITNEIMSVLKDDAKPEEGKLLEMR